MNKHALEGRRFGKLLVLYRGKKESSGCYHWVCRCDCGKEIQSRGSVLKQLKRLNCGCRRLTRDCPIGTKRIDSRGYVKIKIGYSKIYNKGWKLEHIKIMEDILGRKLFKGETIHHKNGIRNDNKKENLELWIKSQPAGQRVEDMIIFCKNFLEKYEVFRI